MKQLLFSLVLFVIGSGAAVAQKGKVDWVLETDSAGWQARDSQGEVVYKDHLWIFGGWFSSHEPAPRDVWKSPDGKNWELVTKEAPWVHSDLPMSIVFKDRMWMMGGWYNGRMEGHESGNQVWSSEDGETWVQETNAADWSPRAASAIVEFKDKIWILGGIGNYFFSEGTETLKNDVWFSSDGKTWELATADAGWSPRAFHQAVVFNDKIYVMGGGNYMPEYIGYNDVWSSEDGIHWKQETASAAWHHRVWFSSVVYRDRIWLMGGWSHPYKNWNDVWYSKDGKNWKEYKSDVVWPVRHEHSAFVFQDKIWVAGGLVPPLQHDVWSLSLPEGW